MIVPINAFCRQFSKVLLCSGLTGATALAMASEADARNHHHHDHQRPYELRQLRRDLRRETRDDRYVRRTYHRGLNRYPRLMPAYGYRHGSVYTTPAGFGIRLRF